MTIRQYLHSHRTSGRVRIAELIPGATPVLRTQETWFHPKGGGQKADVGMIGPARVLQVLDQGGEVDHLVDSLEGLEVGGEYPFWIDAEARLLNAALHTAGHLLANVLESRHPGLRAVKGHHWPGEAHVTFEGDPAQPLEIASMNATLATLLDQALPVAIGGDPGAPRTIRIGQFAPIPCGGVHLQSLAQLRSLTVTRLSRKKHSISVHYEAVPRP